MATVVQVTLLVSTAPFCLRGASSSLPLAVPKKPSKIWYVVQVKSPSSETTKPKLANGNTFVVDFANNYFCLPVSAFFFA